MRFILILENETGQQIDFSQTANRFMFAKIEGLNPPSGTISTSSYAGMDGSYLNNAFIEKRNVVIPFEMRGFGVEKRRHELYKVVKPSRYIKIYYSTKNISVYAEGIVETCEMENFETLTKGQIPIICPDIYWYSTKTQIAEYSRITGAFHFIFPDNDEPFPIGKYNTQNIMTIVNDGDEVGFTLEISGGPAKNPTIYNAVTDEYMQILGELKDGDIITITTKTGNKTVTLEREGVVTNIINRLVSGSTWLTLRTGENKFYVRASDGLSELKVRLIHRNAYLGV
ncbi:phage tail domain-containing protein [Ruminococcus sp.]|uniref:phage tail domain-containing protein n=1 Tax=Ruminococcus sp. TaxID=41978 RepID=UPI0025E820BD|nr:phage tail domain-containing protein [Ruminococcus sp.]